jgi:BirA family biotin operon repressor/biotin-[acetyl-CoA-carboxylase] ligase
MPIHWPAESIWEQVAPGLPGFTVEVVPAIDSTNTELMRRARGGQTDPVLLVAETQSAGRGRMGRSWSAGAEPGDTLTFSLGLPLEPADWSGLSLVVGVALARALGPAVQVKWPNDLWWQERKLAGVLIETLQSGAVRYAVIGVGLNVAPPPAAGLATPPASLADLDPGLTAPAALLRLVPPLVQAVQGFEATGFAPWRSAYAACDALAGREVVLSNGQAGRCQGVDDRGALLVHTPSDGLVRVTSAEVSVRPRP